MIQRIQSVFLLLSSLSFLGTGFFRTAVVGVESFEWLPMALLGLNGLVGVGALAAIFFFKDRKQQLKTTNFLQYGAIVALLAAFGASYLSGALNEITTNVGAMALLILPILGYLFIRLASARIKKDIELVRSMDRLR